MSNSDDLRPEGDSPLSDENREITQWIPGLGEGDQQAVQAVWEKYFDRLVRYARKKLEGMPRRVADEEDVALSAMFSFCRGMEAGRFEKVEGRDDLWKLLVTITARKACAQRRRQYAAKRGGGQVRGESIFVRGDNIEGRSPGIGDFSGDEPTPEMANMVVEETRGMLDGLGDDTLREIALLKLEGFDTTEIAERLGCVRRTVERKLERIRNKWSQEAIP